MSDVIVRVSVFDVAVNVIPFALTFTNAVRAPVLAASKAPAANPFIAVMLVF